MAATLAILASEIWTQKVSEKLTIRKPDVWLSDAYCNLQSRLFTTPKYIFEPIANV
jgi:hypothetical protein